VFKERKNKAPYLKHYCRGMTDRQIAEITDRSVTAVIHWRKRNNLPPNPKNALRFGGEEHRYIMKFINTWRNEKGVKQVWDSPAPQKSREKKKQSA
jgi:hypothetical protein